MSKSNHTFRPFRDEKEYAMANKRAKNIIEQGNSKKEKEKAKKKKERKRKFENGTVRTRPQRLMCSHSRAHLN